MKRSFRIGTRGSLLALWQANYIKDLLLASRPELHPEIRIIKTTGDRNLESPLSEIGGKGVFVKEIEEALLSEDVDIAVHSMKDLPAVLPPGLVIGAVAERHDPRDALLSEGDIKLDELPEGARVGTGSLRRGAQLLNLMPGLRIVPIRGNVDTRVKKLREGEEYDAVILAAAGLGRMGLLEEAAEIIPADVIVPAPGQGIIAVECREGDGGTRDIISVINHGETWTAGAAERAFLRRLGGDCNIPAGCYAEVGGDWVTITGILASPDGKTVIREHSSGDANDAEALGRALAGLILDKGGDRLTAAR
ncbi:MAG: hydroxymethylbilane synthase [Thermodesulfobacteriota bacterium]